MASARTRALTSLRSSASDSCLASGRSAYSPSAGAPTGTHSQLRVGGGGRGVAEGVNPLPTTPSSSQNM